MRLQLALNVDDLDTAIDYYRRLFGVALNKRETGYANFIVDSHQLKLVLFENPGAERLNHVGFEVDSDAEVAEATTRLDTAGVLAETEARTVCCYARQNKAIAYDPQGLMWEWYRLLEDSPTFYEASESTSEGKVEQSVCCAEAPVTAAPCC